MALLSLTAAPTAARAGLRLRPARSPASDLPDRSGFVSQMLPRRVVRVAAAFVRSANSAQALRLTLCRQLGLPAEQVLVLGPADALPTRFADVAEHWARLRPPPQAAPDRAVRAAPVLAGPPLAWGLLGGAAAGLLVGQAAGVGLGAQCALLAVFMAAGLALGLLGPPPAAAAAARPAVRPRRFDACLQRRLASGQHAVVVQGVAGERALAVVQVLRRSGVYWCAEAPLQPL